MGRLGRDHVERYFDIHKLCDELVLLYQQVIGQNYQNPKLDETDFCKQQATSVSSS